MNETQLSVNNSSHEVIRESTENMSIRRRIGNMLSSFGHPDAAEWSESHPIDLDSMELVELSLKIEAAFDVDFRDDLIPPSPNMGDFVDMVEAAMRQSAVDGRKKNRMIEDMDT